ncbi:hypothetical protein [Levilactobacillus namurensis]|uniref:hypothetical protein n=1 Tax=Levilactobacillus namurensis TaxID=380393 RepID=UPI00222E8AE6|nr:hypothetical protein [Levilactobacillus namurensis]MCW3778055.1 hypothetical protein [Levilactobacillus namurensis]MDT7018403.1 hypothetical protein [Levilactobacillus namurensis]WNN64611.1 hypothetical protein RIN67_07780 [Levilactobacillus namurensis]
MALIIEIIIGIIIAWVVYVLIHHMVVQRATRIVRHSAQTETDVAVQAAIQRLVNQEVLTEEEAQLSPSVTVADVWGRGVMAFEYTMTVGMDTEKRLPQLEQALNLALDRFSADHEIRGCVPGSAFIVSDIWVYEDQLHLDVAYLMNESTVEYLQDLKKLNDPVIR